MIRKSGRRRVLTIALAVSLACGLATLGSGHAGAEAPVPKSGDVVYTTVPEISEAGGLQRQPDSVQELAWSAAELVDLHPDVLLGSYVSEDGVVVVVAGADEGRVLAEKALGSIGGLRIEDSDWTADDLSDLGPGLIKSAGIADGTIFAWGPDPESGGMLISAGRDLTDLERAAVQEFAESHGLAIRVAVIPGMSLPRTMDSRLVDTSQYAGGARIGIGTTSNANTTDIPRRCTSGFGYHRNGEEQILTAGHCFPRNGDDDYMWILTNQWDPYEYAGNAVAATWEEGTGTVAMGDDSGYHGDLSLVNVTNAGNGSGHQIW